MPFIRTLSNWLSAPLQYDLGLRARIRIAGLAGLAVFGVLALYQPFGTYEDPLENKVWLLSGYGWVTGLVVGLVHYLFALGLRNSPPPRWTWARHGLFLLAVWISASTGNFGYYCWVFDLDWDFAGWLRFLWLTFLVGIYPVALVTFVRRRGQPTQSGDVEAETPATPEEPMAATTEPAEPTVLLEGENRDDRLQLRPSQLLFAKAADNYCEVVFRQEGAVQRRLLRCTLTRLAEQLDELAVCRCHRSYLANLSQVVRTTGNSQTFRLHLEDTEEPIPVARSYVQDIREALAEPSVSLANGP